MTKQKTAGLVHPLQKRCALMLLAQQLHRRLQLKRRYKERLFKSIWDLSAWIMLYELRIAICFCCFFFFYFHIKSRYLLQLFTQCCFSCQAPGNVLWALELRVS